MLRKRYNFYVVDDVFDDNFACDFARQRLEDKYANSSSRMDQIKHKVFSNPVCRAMLLDSNFEDFEIFEDDAEFLTKECYDEEFIYHDRSIDYDFDYENDCEYDGDEEIYGYDE